MTSPDPYHDHYLSLNEALVGEGYEHYELPSLDPHLPANRDANLIDLGCGIGVWLHALQRKGYRNLEGVDAASGQIKFARRKLSAEVKLSVADMVSHLAARPSTIKRTCSISSSTFRKPTCHTS